MELFAWNDQKKTILLDQNLQDLTLIIPQNLQNNNFPHPVAP